MGEIIMRNCDLGGFHVWVTFTIPYMVGTSPDPEGTITDLMSSKPNQLSPTPDFSFLFVSFIRFPYSSLFAIHNSAIIAEHNVMSSLSISPYHDQEIAPTTVYNKYSTNRKQHTPATVYTEYSIHWAQHTLGTAYTKYSIHQIQHTPNTAYTEYSIHWV